MKKKQIAYFLLFITPFFFCVNIIVARASYEIITPFLLAGIRWIVAASILTIFSYKEIIAQKKYIWEEKATLLVLGFFGMFVCGAFVYIGSQTSTATNIGILFSVSPVAIVLFARFFFKEKLSKLQWLGISIAILGVVLILSKGKLRNFLNLNFEKGDWWIFISSLGWAIYSLRLKFSETKFSSLTRLALIAWFGVLTMLPLMIYEYTELTQSIFTWKVGASILTLALIPSLLAYQSYAFVQTELSASTAGIIMYLVPFYNGLLAFLILGESIEIYHFIGGIITIIGVWLSSPKQENKE